jgi:hypothetical protein
VTGDTPPEAWLLCVPGESFELGERLSATAVAHLEAAWMELRRAVGATAAADQNIQP